MADFTYMDEALMLAEQGLGRTAPNPSVGCVIVRDGVVVGRGRTGDGGRPHAEIVALAEAGERAKGADVYVTLEPCAHHGQTGPCAEALVAAGVAWVVVACHDPDHRVSGRGVQILRDAGVTVEAGVRQAEAEALNAGFFLSVTQARPLVSLKMAVSVDGKIASASPKLRRMQGAAYVPVQITGAEAAVHMHTTLRATHDAIAVGRGTVEADDPLLTTRVDGVQHDSKRVVLGRYIPAGTQLAQADGVIVVDDHDVQRVLRSLVVDHGVTRLLVEGGAQVMTAFLASGLWDRLYIYRSPMVIGDDGLDAPRFGGHELLETQQIGLDALEIYGAKA